MSQFAFVYRQAGPELSPEEMQRHIAKCQQWFRDLIASGSIDDPGVPLSAAGSAMVTKNHVVHDGPFAEAKDVVGGFTLVRAANLEEAIELAKTCPILDVGSKIEVRPVKDSPL